MPLHHPPHLFHQDAWYLVTAGTYGHAPYLATDSAKTLLREALHTLAPELGLSIAAWVLMDNHYHLLARPAHSTVLPRFFGKLHGSTSRKLNLLDNTPGRQVWHNYWDACVRGERDFWTRFNYIHHNPVKHGYARKSGDWEYSSYRYYVRQRGEEWLADCWERYPVVEPIGHDDFA